VACLEEIAYNNEWLSAEELISVGTALKKTEYGQYILNLVK